MHERLIAKSYRVSGSVLPMSYKYLTSDLKELKRKGLCGSGTECVVLIPGILSQVCAGGVEVDKGGFATGAVGLN